MSQFLKFWGFCAFVGISCWPTATGLYGGESTAYIGTRASSSEPAIDSLVKSLAEPLKAVKAKNVVVFDLRGPNGGVYPAGKWISDHVSVAMRTEFPKLKIIDRSQLNSNDEVPGDPMDKVALFEREVKEARSVGADVAIAGNFAGVSGRIGVSLSVIGLSGLGKTHEVRTGLIPIPSELADQTSQAIPPLELEDGFPRAGESGINMPLCTYCPSPGNGLTGLVTLQIVVTQDGRPDKITVLKSPSPELATAAVKTVQAWRFKPAVGFDGNPIAVITPIQILFR